jgi:ribose/xylose/arabinose/galactoside ABC-type transport system permease subunit
MPPTDAHEESPRGGGGRAGAVRAFAAWWVLCAALWLALIDRIRLDELLTGVVAATIGAGFLGGIAAGFIAGYATRWLNGALRLPRNLEGLKPTLLLPLGGTLVVGLLIGSLHAWLITVIGLPPFVATLATLVGLRSLGRAIVENVTTATWSAKSTQIQIFDKQFRYLATSVWIPVVLFLGLAALMWLLMSRTVVGRHLHALGGNEQAARLSGIQTDRLKWLAYCLSAVLSSLAGILYIGDTSVADPQTLGRGYELNAIAAAIIGGTALTGGRGTIVGSLFGVLIFSQIANLFTVNNLPTETQRIVNGAIIVGAVLIQQFRLADLRRRPKLTT